MCSMSGLGPVEDSACAQNVRVWDGLDMTGSLGILKALDASFQESWS